MAYLMPLPEPKPTGDTLWAAIRSTEAAVAAAPGGAEGGYYLGLLYYKAGELELAATAFRQMTARRPDHVQAWHALAVTLVALRRPQEAIAALETALAGGPRTGVLLADLGLLLAEAGERKRASRVLEEAVATEDLPLETRETIERIAQEQQGRPRWWQRLKKPRLRTQV